MLSITKPLSASKAKSYHELEYTDEKQSYYKEGSTIKGEWQGQLATRLGLSGEVSPREYSRLADGKHPLSEEQMVKHRDGKEYTNADGSITKPVEHRAGWDATFSAPKSISLTALVGGDERVRLAHAAAVTTALDELEKYTQARIGGNHAAETTGKFIAAKFEHDTARPVDGYAAPQLHTHVVIFNVTERSDGSTRSIQPKSLFETQNYATAVYQSALTLKLRKLGYEIEAGESGAPEIKGYSRAYLVASSQRSEVIKEQLAKTGHSGPESAQIAAHSTREKKQTLSKEEALSAHKKMAADFGDQPDQVIAAARHRAQEKDFAPRLNTTAKEAVTFAKDRAFEREAVADERLIFRDALRRGMGDITLSDVRDNFNERRKQGEFRTVDTPKHGSGRQFTTPQMIATERANVQYVLDGQASMKAMLSKGQADRQANSRDFLNESQRAAIREVLTSTDRVHGLQGLAGSGKTTTLATIREGAEQGGYAVEGFAPTSRAAGQLREAGIGATTLQSFLARKEKPDDTASKHLYLLDESSLASSRQMRAFLDKLKPEDRVLVIGDTRQHQGVDAGRPFEQMQQAGMQTSQLDRIMRQKDPKLLEAVQHLARNETEKGIAMLSEQGRVTEIPSGKDRIRAIAKDYADKPENTIIVSPDNKSRQQINDAVRNELLKNGTLAEDGRTFQTLSHRSDLTGADRTWAERYQPGDVVQYGRGSKEYDITRGSVGVVRSVDAATNHLHVELADGSAVQYDPRRLYGVNVYRETSREFATGDRLQFSGADKKMGIANRDLGTITGIKDEQITVRMDGEGERSITIDATKFRQFDHGYAVTSHSSQGLTAGRVIAHMDTDSSRSLINTRLAYVAISRASDDARIYTNNAATLGSRLATEVSKTAAVDFRPKETRTTLEPAEITKPQHRPPQTRSYEFADAKGRLAAVAEDYASKPEKAVVIAPDTDERKELNQLIRSNLYMQGKLASQARELSILIEKPLSNPKLAANYTPGDKIHYRTGSPSIEGIPDNSEATVVGTDAKRNVLTIERTDGHQIAYNPIHLKQQTRESTVFQEETREIAAGERIQFTAPDRGQGIRKGDFGTVESIADNNTMAVRLENGKVAELSPEKARHIDYGYAVDGSHRVTANRILATGDGIARENLNAAHLRTSDVALYTSRASHTQHEELSNENQPSISELPRLSEKQQQGFGLGF